MNALTTYTPNDILTTAKALIASGFLPKSIDTVDKAFAIITMSQELGIGMWQGLNGINVIQGKPTVSPQLMLALINRSGQLEDMQIDANADRAIVTLKRRGRTAHTETFTIKDAAAQGLTGKDNYRKQPATMLKWRAVAAAARVVFPDAIMGLYTVEEIAPDAVTVTEDGEATYTPPAITVTTPVQPDVTVTSEGEAKPSLHSTLLTVTRRETKAKSTYYQFGTRANVLAYSWGRDPFREVGFAPCETWKDLPVGESFELPQTIEAQLSWNGKSYVVDSVFLFDDALAMSSGSDES